MKSPFSRTVRSMALATNSRRAIDRSVQSIAPKSRHQPMSSVLLLVPPSLQTTRLIGLVTRPSLTVSSRVVNSRRVLPQ